MQHSKKERPTSALGQKQTLGKVRLMSALPPKADIAESDCDVLRSNFLIAAAVIRIGAAANLKLVYQNGFQVGLSVNLSQPRLAPSRRPIPERIGTTTILFPVSAVMPKPPTR